MRKLAAARLQLRGVAGELTGMFFELERLLRAMGTSPEERSQEDLDDLRPSPAVELRTAILCGLQDHLQPLIRDFLVASGCAPAEVARATPVLAEELRLAAPDPCAPVAPWSGEPPEGAVS